jgi:hypothetical protein
MAVVGFFLPWARIDAREPSVVTQLRQTMPLRDAVGGLAQDVSRITVKIRRGTEVVTGRLPSLSAIPQQVSGFQIPRMANQEEAKIAVALVELMTNQRQQIGIKSYAVYLLPGAALVCAVALTIVALPAAVAIAIAAFGAALAGLGGWKLLTVDTQTLFMAITIGAGLWLSLWAYVGLAIASGLDALRRRR